LDPLVLDWIERNAQPLPLAGGARWNAALPILFWVERPATRALTRFARRRRLEF